MLHWYCKTTHNLGQVFFSKVTIIWDEESKIKRMSRTTFVDN